MAGKTGLQVVPSPHHSLAAAGGARSKEKPRQLEGRRGRWGVSRESAMPLQHRIALYGRDVAIRRPRSRPDNERGAEADWTPPRRRHSLAATIVIGPSGVRAPQRPPRQRR
jgi:hypothetical protein